MIVRGWSLCRVVVAVVMAVMSAISVRAYTVDEIPNVHVADRTKYVSNPDGVLSPSAVMQLDSLVGQVWNAGGVEMAVVAVDDIGDADIQDFANELFGKWGIGKKDKDNGLLVLIVRGQRKAVIRTGYGVEGVVPDVVAGRIIRNDMVPFYREGDYDNGTIEAVAHLTRLLTDPEVRDELASGYANDRDAHDEADANLFLMYLCVAVGMTI
ncbi:MAG: TPM domain-containing protein, partial [Muribaculaceae bacterium]|nr:TPM domain-containing protein [Muribaculaceae bacterium]